MRRLLLARFLLSHSIKSHSPIKSQNKSAENKKKKKKEKQQKGVPLPANPKAKKTILTKHKKKKKKDTVVKMKNQRQTNLIIRSSLALALALAIWSPVQARSAEPVEGKVMTAAAMEPGSQEQMNPYFSAINYNLPKDTLMLMLLPDFQIARTGPNFLTGMIMAEYGLTDRLTVGVMAEGQKISRVARHLWRVAVQCVFSRLPR